MSIKYVLLNVQNPVTGKNEHYAKAVYGQTVNSKQLEREIQHGTTLTSSDVKACLSALSSQILQHLKDGKSVHLEGIGYLKVSLQCSPKMDPAAPSGRFVNVKTVKFRPEKGLVDDLTDTPMEMARDHMCSASVTMDELLAIVHNHFRTNTYMRRVQFQKLAHLTKEMACSRLNELVAHGVLRKEGPKNSPIYFLVK